MRFVFIGYPYTKKSLRFATYVKVWNIQFNICSLFFRDFKYLIFSFFSVHFTGPSMIYWRWIFKNQERFLSITDPFTKTSLIFYTGVKVWKIQFNLCSLFSRDFKVLIFSCFSVHLAGQILINWRWILKKKRGFCSARIHSQKYLSGFTQVSGIEICGSFFDTYFPRNSPYLLGIRFAIFSQLVELVS